MPRKRQNLSPNSSNKKQKETEQIEWFKKRHPPNFSKRWTQLIEKYDYVTDMHRALRNRHEFCAYVDHMTEKHAEGKCFLSLKMDGISGMLMVMMSKIDVFTRPPIQITKNNDEEEQISPPQVNQQDLFETTFQRTSYYNTSSLKSKIHDGADDFLKNLNTDSSRIVDLDTSLDVLDHEINLEQPWNGDNFKLVLGLGAPDYFVFKYKDFYWKFMLLDQTNCVPYVLRKQYLQTVFDQLINQFQAEFAKEINKNKVGVLTSRVEKILFSKQGRYPPTAGLRQTSAFKEKDNSAKDNTHHQTVNMYNIDMSTKSSANDPIICLLYDFFDILKENAYKCFIKPEFDDNIFNLAKLTNILPHQSKERNMHFPILSAGLSQTFAFMNVPKIEEVQKNNLDLFYTTFEQQTIDSALEGWVMWCLKGFGTETCEILEQPIKYKPTYECNILKGLVGLSGQSGEPFIYDKMLLTLIFGLIYPCSCINEVTQKQLQSKKHLLASFYAQHMKLQQEIQSDDRRIIVHQVLKTFMKTRQWPMPDKSKLHHTTLTSLHILDFFRVNAQKQLECTFKNEQDKFAKEEVKNALLESVNNIMNISLDTYQESMGFKVYINTIHDVLEKHFKNGYLELEKENIATVVSNLQDRLSYKVSHSVENFNSMHVPVWFSASVGTDTTWKSSDWYKKQHSWFTTEVLTQREQNEQDTKKSKKVSAMIFTNTTENDKKIKVPLELCYFLKKKQSVSDSSPDTSNEPENHFHLDTIITVAHGTLRSSLNALKKNKNHYESTDDQETLLFRSSKSEKGKPAMAYVLPNRNPDSNIDIVIADLVLESFIFLLLIAGLDAKTLTIDNIASCNNVIKAYVLQVLIHKRSMSVTKDYVWPQEGWLNFLKESNQSLKSYCKAINPKDVVVQDEENPNEDTKHNALSDAAKQQEILHPYFSANMIDYSQFCDVFLQGYPFKQDLMRNFLNFFQNWRLNYFNPVLFGSQNEMQFMNLDMMFLRI